MARESTVWSFLEKGTKGHEEIHMTRIENAAGVSTPDVEGCRLSHQFWLELKVADRPAKAKTPIRFKSKLKTGQVEWAEKRIKAGGFVGFLVQVGEGSDRALYLLHGLDGARIAEGVNEEWLYKRNMLASTKPTALDVIFTASSMSRTQGADLK